MKKISLICLPFAGGNKYSYKIYKEYLPPQVSLITLEYPGRGGRINESLLQRMEPIIEDLYAQFLVLPLSVPYSIYGHSMGGLAAYLLTKKINKERKTMPQQLFITGSPAPTALIREKKNIHLLNSDQLWAKLKLMKGMDETIFTIPELMNYLEPILRADFEANETYLHQYGDKLDIPITIISGQEDVFTEMDLWLWQEETKREIDLHIMTGEHFFIFKHAREVMNIVTTKLLNHR